MASGDWDPMLMDYQDPQFNRYHQGVGRDLSDGNWKGSKLFVDNFPTDLGQEGFVNLFSECGHVVEAILKPSNRSDKRFTYGFVTMESAVSAEYAISRLNQRMFRSGMQPLKVSPALTDDEKKRRNESKEAMTDFMSSIRGKNFNRDDDMMSSISTYGMGPNPMYDERGFGPRRAGLLDDRVEYGGGQRGRGFYHDTNDYGMMGREVFMMGRGRAQNLRNPQPFVRGINEGFPKPFFGGRGRGRGQLYHNERPFQRENGGMSIGRGLGLHNMQMNVPRRPQQENFKICVCCGTEGSSLRCGVCKMYYCSPQCQRKDWPNHREICLDISIHRFKMKMDMDSNGLPTMDTAKQNDHFDRKSVSSNQSNQKFKPNDKNDDSKSGKFVKPGKTSKQNGRGYESESGNKTNVLKNGRQGNKNKTTEIIPKETKGRQQEKNNDRNSQAQESVKENDNREPMVFRNSKNNHKDTDRNSVKKDDKMNESEKRNAQGKFDKKKPGLDKNQQKKKPLESDIVSVLGDGGEKKMSPKPDVDVKGVASNISDDMDGSGDASCDLTGLSMDIGNSGECYLSHFESPSKIWIILKEDTSDFFNLSEGFKLLVEEMPKNSVKRVKAGELYCIIHESFWTRIKIVTVSGKKVTVFFPDVGRQETVNISDLYPLDENMRYFPALAICCCIGKVKPIGKSTWDEKARNRVEKWLAEPYTKDLSFKVVDKRGSTHALTLSYKGEDLSETLVSEGLAELAGTSANLPKLSNVGDVSKNVKKPERFMAKDLKSQASCLEENETIHINISDFESPSSFVGHIITSDTTKTISCIEKIMHDMKLDSGKPYSPTVGELVLAKFSIDKKWYRSEVLKINGESYQVLFVDYGNQEVLTCKDIRQIEDKALVTFPALASRLGLWGVPADINTEDVIDKIGDLLSDFAIEEGQWSVVIKSKKDSLMLVDFVAWTQKDSLSMILRERLSPKKASPMAKIQAVISPKAGAARDSKVADLPTDTLPSDGKSEVVVNFVNKCASFYVMLKSNCESLQTLMMDINSRVESVPVIEKPVAGNLVLAQYVEDQTWYRAQVKSVKNLQKCIVFFLDYGNTEEVAIEGLRQLPSWAVSQPTMAIHCGLNVESVKLAHDADETFKVIETKIVNVSVLKRDSGKYIVKMVTEEGSDLLEHLAVGVETQECAIPDANLDAGANIKVSCIRVLCRKEFYVQLSSQIAHLNQATQERRQLIAKNDEPLTKVKEGDYVAAQYNKDRDWHRVRVDDVKGNECSVFFIDYGYIENVSISSLRKLPKGDFSSPACTVTCALKNCIPGQKLDNFFVTEAEHQIDSIRVCGEDNGFKLVDIFDHSGVCITDRFTGQNAPQVVEGKKKSLPQKSHTPSSPLKSNSPSSVVKDKNRTIKTDSIFETDERVMAIVTYIQSVCDFHICGDRMEVLSAVMASLQTDAPSEPTLKEFCVGAFCSAQFEEDQMWYRAQINSVGDETCVVKFIDYGNTQMTKKKELRQLPDSAWSLPAVAIPCCFKEFESYIGQDQNLELLSKIHKSEEFTKLKEEVTNNAVFVTLHQRRSGVAIVSLADTDSNDILNMYGIQASSPSSPKTLKDIPVTEVKDSNFEVICTNLENLTEFCCQRKDNVEKVLEISSSLEQDLMDVGCGKCKPVVNGVYASLFEYTWYRCVVEEIDGDKVTVRYFDWGNKEERLASDLRPLQLKYFAYPVSLMKCKLHGVEMVPNSTEKVQEYIQVLNKKLETNHLYLSVKDKEGELYHVSLAVVTDDNASVDIAKDLVEVGIARSLVQNAVPQLQSPRQEIPEEEEEDDEDDKELEELKKKMEEIQLRKSKKK